MVGYLKRWSIAALCLSGLEGYLHCGFDANWACLGASGTLAQCIGYLDARTSAGLQWEWRHWCCAFVPSTSHTRHHMYVACNRSPSNQRTHVMLGPHYTKAPRVEMFLSKKLAEREQTG